MDLCGAGRADLGVLAILPEALKDSSDIGRLVRGEVAGTSLKVAVQFSQGLQVLRHANAPVGQVCSHLCTRSST